jgi:hypothetical protein
VHIDAWPADEKKKFGYAEFGDAYSENQKSYKDISYESDIFYADNDINPKPQKKSFEPFKAPSSLDNPVDEQIHKKIELRIKFFETKKAKEN